MTDYVKIIGEQKKLLEKLMRTETIVREPLRQIDLQSPCAQVVIGMRRCGKSVLCRQALAAHPDCRYGYVNFEDEALKDLVAQNLNDVLEAVYAVYGEIDVLYLDEVQNVEGWEFFVNRLLQGGMRLLVTGSNSKLLSTELSTHLTGRYIATELFAFSFSEYRRFFRREFDGSTAARAELRRDFVRYFENGGLPETFHMPDVRGYHEMLYLAILHQDIVRRHRIRNIEDFERVARVVLWSFAQVISYTNLTKRLEMANVHTVQKYVGYLEEAYLVHSLKRYSTKRTERGQVGKVYASDVGLVTYFTGVAESDESRGRRLENIVFLQLKAKRKALDNEIYYYQDDRHEVDFALVRLGRITQLIQVSYVLESPKTRERELSALFEVGAKLGCPDLLLVTDHETGEERRGDQVVRIVDAPSWLLKVEKPKTIFSLQPTCGGGREMVDFSP